jgi:hypothetical protein
MIGQNSEPSLSVTQGTDRLLKEETFSMCSKFTIGTDMDAHTGTCTWAGKYNLCSSGLELRFPWLVED